MPQNNNPARLVETRKTLDFVKQYGVKEENLLISTAGKTFTRVLEIMRDMESQ